MNFPIDFPQLLSIPVRRTFREHRGRSDASRAVDEYPSHAVVVVDCCSVSVLSLGLIALRILASTSAKHCNTCKTTNCCSNPTKVSINGSPYIICRWEEGTTVVNGRAWTQTIVMMVILPSRRTKLTLQKLRNDILSPNFRPNCQKNAIGPHRRCIPSYWKPRYLQFGVDRHACYGNDIVVEKLGRIWRFWFYLSLCESAIGCQHKLHNPHMHFHSLVYTLAGLTEKSLSIW